LQPLPVVVGFGRGRLARRGWLPGRFRLPSRAGGSRLPSRGRLALHTIRWSPLSWSSRALAQRRGRERHRSAESPTASSPSIAISRFIAFTAPLLGGQGDSFYLSPEKILRARILTPCSRRFMNLLSPRRSTRSRSDRRAQESARSVDDEAVASSRRRASRRRSTFRASRAAHASGRSRRYRASRQRPEHTTRCLPSSGPPHSEHDVPCAGRGRPRFAAAFSRICSRCSA
jgi:hypothetical protein